MKRKRMVEIKLLSIRNKEEELRMKYTNTYRTLAEFGRKLLNKPTLAEGLPIISAYAKDVIKAERCSIFIYDADKQNFWTTISDGVDKITIPADKGIIGYTFKTKEPVLTNDAYAHPKFLAQVDKTTGYKTRNIITSPIFSSKREVIAVLQLLNKEEDFDEEDKKFMTFFSHYISGFLELSDVFLREDIKQNEVTIDE